MGLGSTAKKVQRLSELAEKLYAKVNEVLERLADLQDRVEQSTEDVRAVRREQREQRAVLEALAVEQGVDVEAVIADVDGPEGADVEDAEPDVGEADDEASGESGA